MLGWKATESLGSGSGTWGQDWRDVILPCPPGAGTGLLFPKSSSCHPERRSHWPCLGPMLTPIPGNGVNSTELPSLSWGLDGAQRKTQRHGGGGRGGAGGQFPGKRE